MSVPLVPNHCLQTMSVGLLLLFATEWGHAEELVDFDRDIRPILSDNCFQCHGPDENKRDAELRLDRKEDAFGIHDGITRIVPGTPGESELFRRISATDPGIRMPPHDSGQSLTDQQILLIRDWIAQGAEWKEHWAFVAPARPSEPVTKTAGWIRNAVDSFILSRLESAGLEPTTEADRPTLIRRVTLDLTGLPPSPEEIDAFVEDVSPGAWEKVVDRLLRSSEYGERMTVRWLDLARYSDTSGYQNDGPRTMWRWRDWVINAYNVNMPFDQFTIEQLAGDMIGQRSNSGRIGLGSLSLDEEALDRWIATGFNRNHRSNSEGGVDPDEYQVEYVVDRVDTTATVWLGLTMGCARCHDHKYDPISQKDFFQVFACFNNIPENGRAIKEGNSPPYIKAPTTDQRMQLEQFDREIADLEQQWEDTLDAANNARIKWEASLSAEMPDDWALRDGLIAHLQLDGSLENCVVVSDQARSTEATAAPGEPMFVPGRFGRAVELTGEGSVVAGDFGKFEYRDPFTLAAWVKAESDGTILARKTPSTDGQGYSVGLQDGRLYVNLVNRWLDDSIRLTTVNSISRSEWHHLTVTYDGSRQAAGIVTYIDGQVCKVEIHHDFLNQTFVTAEPFQIGSGLSNLKGLVDEVRVYNRTLSIREVGMIATADTLAEIAMIPADQRTVPQLDKLQHGFLNAAAPDGLKSVAARLKQSRQERAQLITEMPTTMVMQESSPRTTRILSRGQFDQPRDEVEPGVPSALVTNNASLPDGRLGLARWLVSGEHPLTARVAVNRYWQMYFGEGLVETMEDFGSQGSRPTHPELLDWLATEFVASGWNIKHMQKLIVMSATYRQSSFTTKELRERDPKNLLLTRGPRFRLTAEVVRDQALAASGLLHHKVGGPSVKTYQPDGLWSEFATDTVYELATGDDLYRRSLYTYWKRTVAPPGMMTFDATTREMCTVRRARTNTPLQALTLMNDVTYVEASRSLAERMIREGGAEVDGRVIRGLRLVIGRVPTEQELAVLRSAVSGYKKRFTDNPKSAQQLIGIGNSEAASDINANELATWTALASVILNLDETVTRR